MTNSPEREELPELPDPVVQYEMNGLSLSGFVRTPFGTQNEIRDGMKFVTIEQCRAYGRLCRAGLEDVAELREFVRAAIHESGQAAFGLDRRHPSWQRAKNAKDELHKALTLIDRRLSPQAGGGDE